MSTVGLNQSALGVMRHMQANRLKEEKSLRRLATGTRINSASEDAAGLAISENLRADIRSLGQAGRNAQDAVSMVQVSEGSLNEIGNILVRLRELSIQGASDTVGDGEREFIDREVQQLKEEVDRISETTEFNGTKLLNGSVNRLDFQVGIQNTEYDRLSFDTVELANGSLALGIFDVNTLDQESSQENLAKIDFAIRNVNENRAVLGALQNRLESTTRSLRVSAENLSAAKSRISDADYAVEASNLVAANIISSAGIAVLSHTKTQSEQALKLLK